MVERKTGLLPVEHLRIHSQPKEEHMLNEPTGWQVWTTVEGVADLDIEVATAADARRSVQPHRSATRDEGLAYESLRAGASTRRAREDCDCVQWLTDHQPRYSYQKAENGLPDQRAHSQPKEDTMTSTTDVSIQQLRGISDYVASLEADHHDVVRVLLTPHDSSKNVRLETRSLYEGDVLTGTRIVLRDSGEVVTQQGYGEYVRRIYCTR
jgi:hypothetical protein